MKKVILLFACCSFLMGGNYAQTVTDIDGNVYNTVTIGTQVWLKENLKTTKFNDGNSIPNITDATAWASLTTPAYCWYNNDEPANKNTYGALYNWRTVNSGKLCPSGLHVPTDLEWTELTDYLGGENLAGGKLKETGTLHWNSPNTGATNETGFTALPGGNRAYYRLFCGIGDFGFWWSTTEHETRYAWYRQLHQGFSFVMNAYHDEQMGLSVRCLRNTPAEIKEIKNPVEIQIYPNPATDKLYIHCDEIQNMRMQLFNIVGECVLQTELNKYTNEIDISSLLRGIYILKLTGTNRTLEKQIIKQ